MSEMKRWEHLKIPLAEIKKATNDFRKLIGEGGYGWVYEGELTKNKKHMKVAVKRLNTQFKQGIKQFLTEVSLLSGQQHENVITLVGYCDDEKEKILVYEYAEKGSLDQHIRRTDKGYTLTWIERLKIVADVACGLDHLHNHLQNNKVIIHRDIKCSNILIDHNWVAKISDLGLSKLTFSGLSTSDVISQPCGTRTYLEPEYFWSDMVHKKTDVYSFGMVLFEVLCGRLSYVRDEDGILLLAGVAKKYYAGDKLDTIIDPVLRKQMSPESLTKFSAIAYKCLQKREHRPLIEVVKKELEDTLKIQIQHEERKRLKIFLQPSEEDIVDDEYWKKKLPNRYQRYIQRSDKPLLYTNKRELYLRLCEGFLCDDDKMWISLCVSSNKICSMLSTTQILCKDIKHEGLDSLSLYGQSRFSEVKVLGYASSYSFACTLQLQMFSPQSTYACYLVFKFKHNKRPDDCLFKAEYGLDHRFLGKVLVHMNVFSKNKPTIKLKSDDQGQGTKGVEMTNDGLEYDLESWMEERKDGWIEAMLSKPLERLEDYSTLKVRLSALSGSFGGIIVEGIEFRPYI